MDNSQETDGQRPLIKVSRTAQRVGNHTANPPQAQTQNIARTKLSKQSELFGTDNAPPATCRDGSRFHAYPESLCNNVIAW